MLAGVTLHTSPALTCRVQSPCLFGLICFHLLIPNTVHTQQIETTWTQALVLSVFDGGFYSFTLRGE